MSMTYHEQLDRKNTLKLRELQAELPAFAGDFFRAMEKMCIRDRVSTTHNQRNTFRKLYRPAYTTIFTVMAGNLSSQTLPLSSCGLKMDDPYEM